MSAVGTDPEETAAYLDEHGEFAGAELIRSMAAEMDRLSGLLREASPSPAFTPAPDACQVHAFTGQPGTPCPQCGHSRYADCHPSQD